MTHPTDHRDSNTGNLSLHRSSFLSAIPLLFVLPQPFLMGINACTVSDADMDDYTVEQGDCNDNDASVHPGAEEVCNGVDDNCDGTIDEGLNSYQDADGDQYGDAQHPASCIDAPEGYVSNDDDCNDANANIHPGATEITNNGIDIRTEESSEVSAVYGGDIAGVQFIPGHNYTIIIRHGDYYTVYSNLSDAFVKKGETVAAQQPIGKVSGNPITGATELHFELWLEKERLNPAGWIKR